MQRIGRTPSDRLGALITDAAQRQALVAVRSLGKAGIPCGAVDSDPTAPAFASRWCTTRAIVPDFVEGQHAFLDALLQVCAEHRPQVLIPVHDGSVEALRLRREELERVVGLALGPEEALAVAVDKARTLAHAQAVGLRAPQGVTVGNPGDADAAVRELGLPLVVKPTRTWVQEDGEGQRLRGVVARDQAEAVAAAGAMLAQGGTQVMLQEWLPGDREAISFMCAHGRIWARFAQRADRTLPHLGGNSILRESIPLPSDVTPQAERLVLEMGLDGYSEVEFRRDADGRAALMEINPRLSASVEIAVRAGVPFPQLLHAWAGGEALREVLDYRLGRRMRWLGGDLPWLEEALRYQDRPEVPSRADALGAFIRDFFRPMSYDYLDRRDLRPALTATAGAMRQLGYRAKRFKGKQASRVHTGGKSADRVDTDVAVIGAGPYGLAISAHLSDSGIDHEIFGEPMDTWKSHMPAGMKLKSEGFASNISDPRAEHTLERYCAESGIHYGALATPIELETFTGYGLWFQQRVVPRLRRSHIERLGRDGDVFVLRTDKGETLRARRVVAATGMQGLSNTPTQLCDLPAEAIAHCFDFTDPGETRGKQVAVIGAGQSALEAAALIHEQGGDVHMVVRGGQVAWNSKPGGSDRPLRERWRYPESGLGEGREQWFCANHPLVVHAAPRRWRVNAAYGILGPSGAWWLRPRIEGKVNVRLQREVLQAQPQQDSGVLLRLRGPDGQEEELGVDTVVAGTGYRASLDRLGLLDPELRDAIASVPHAPGIPKLDRGFQSSVPGLYVVGYMAAVSFGPLMRFVYGTDFMARRIARSLS